MSSHDEGRLWALNDEDVTALLAVLEQPPTADAAQIFYPEVLAGLRELIPCDDLTFQLLQVSTQQVTTLTATDDGVHQDHSVGVQDAFTEVFWQEFWHDAGCAGPLRTRHDRQVAGEPDLTPHQWEVLRHVATGAGNTQITRVLGRTGAPVPSTPPDGEHRRRDPTRGASGPFS